MQRRLLNERSMGHFVKDVGFIALSYALTLGSMIVLALVTVRRARSLARIIPDEDKPWL